MTNMTISSDNQGAAVQDSCIFFLSDECSLVASLPILTVTRECVKAIVHCYAKRTDHESQLGHIQGQIKYNLWRVVVEMYLPNFNKQTKCVSTFKPGQTGHTKVHYMAMCNFAEKERLYGKDISRYFCRDCGESLQTTGTIGTSQCRNMKSVTTECQLHVQIKVLE